MIIDLLLAHTGFCMLCFILEIKISIQGKPCPYGGKLSSVLVPLLPFINVLAMVAMLYCLVRGKNANWWVVISKMLLSDLDKG